MRSSIPSAIIVLIFAVFFAVAAPEPRAQVSGQLPPNDDGSSGLIPLGFTFRFFGVDYTSVYVNNNGNLTFTQPLSTYTPFAFPSSNGRPMIAPFFADVDTRNGKGTVTYQGTAGAFTVQWTNVGYFNALTPDNPDLRNTFSVTLQQNNGIIFQYGAMGWTTGDASGGVDGFGGAPATLGLDQANGVDAVVFRRYDTPAVSELNGTTWYFQTDNAEIPFTPFKQGTIPPGGLWGDQFTINSTSFRMRDTGCFVTSTAMLLTGLGHNTDPGKLNLFLRDYLSGGSLNYNSVAWQNNIFFGQTDGVPGPKVRMRTGGFIVMPTGGPLPPEGDTSLRDQIVSQIGAAIDLFGPIILRIPSRNHGTNGYLSSHTHACIAHAITTGDVTIFEPGWSGSPTGLVAYAAFVNNHLTSHPEWHLHNADGQGSGQDLSFLAPSWFTYPEILTPFSTEIIQGQANSPIEFVVTDPLGRRLGFDPTTNTKYAQIPGSAYFRDCDAAPAEDASLPTPSGHNPIVFEIGDYEPGTYSFQVFGIGAGPWSIQFGLSDGVVPFDPVQYLRAGQATAGSQQAFSVDVSQTTPPVFQAPTPCGQAIAAMVGEYVTFQVSAQAMNGAVDQTVTLNASGLPTGSMITPSLPTTGNPVTVTLGWVPTASQIGPHPITFTITDQLGVSASCSLVVEVGTTTTCADLELAGSGQPGSTLVFALDGAQSHALAFLGVGVNAGPYDLPLGPLGTLQLGIQPPFLLLLMGITNSGGDESLALPVPPGFGMPLDLVAQALSVKLVHQGSDFSLDACTSDVVAFHIGPHK